MSGEDYRVLKLSSGREVHVYPVPDSLIWSIQPSEPRPKRPMVKMQTKTGEQLRPAKEGDTGYDEWIEAVEEWKEAQNRLQESVRLVMALRDVEYPDPLVFPGHVQELIDDGLLVVPENKWLRRAMWLRATLLSGVMDEMNVMFSTQELSGIDQEVIQEMRDNFRNSLRGKATQTVGTGTKPADTGESEV